VELKCSPRGGFDVILATPERVLVYQHRPDAEGLISILKCLRAKNYVLSFPRRVLVELPIPSALGKRLMHFPFEIIILEFSASSGRRVVSALRHSHDIVVQKTVHILLLSNILTIGLSIRTMSLGGNWSLSQVLFPALSGRVVSII
jgi:hypothetical protein